MRARMMPRSNALTVFGALCCGLAGSLAPVNAQQPNVLVVAIKCPAENNGTLEIVRGNQSDGSTHTITVGYKNGRASFLRFSKNGNVTGWNFVTDDYMFYRPSRPNEMRTNVRELMHETRDIADKALRRFCLSEGEERKAALAEIKENRRKLGLR